MKHLRDVSQPSVNPQYDARCNRRPNRLIVMAAGKPVEPLFETLLAESRLRNPEVRAGSMFGSPAVFVGRKMAACVYDGRFALRVPKTVATLSLSEDRATPFRPHGRPAMPEWIALDGGEQALTGKGDLLREAIAFAEANNRSK